MRHILYKYLTGASMIALTFSLNISTANATCSPMPTCESMGYTQTSCPSGVASLKCPFDESKMICIQDCTDYPLSSCNSNYGKCKQCINGKWKYQSCYTGYYRNGDQCSIDYCWGYSFDSEEIPHCLVPEDCVRGEASGGSSDVYACKLCENGYVPSYAGCTFNADVGDIYYYNNLPVGVVYEKYVSADEMDYWIVPLHNLDNALFNRVPTEADLAEFYRSVRHFNSAQEAYSSQLSNGSGITVTEQLADLVYNDDINGLYSPVANYLIDDYPSVIGCEYDDTCIIYLPSMSDWKRLTDIDAETNGAISSTLTLAGGDSINGDFVSTAFYPYDRYDGHDHLGMVYAGDMGGNDSIETVMNTRPIRPLINIWFEFHD